MNDYSDEQWNAMVDLLTYVAAADRRTVGDTDVRVWLDAATDAGWPSMDAAYRAVVKHRNARPGTWLEPGHITAQLAEVRRAASEAFQRPRDRDIPNEVLADPAAYQRFIAERVAEHHAAALSAFVRDGRTAIEAGA